MEEYAIFCTRIDFRYMFVMPLDFADIKQRTNAQGNESQDALSALTAIF